MFGVDRLAWCGGKKSLRICLAVSSQYQRVTDRQTDRQTDRHLANLANYSYLVQCVALLGKNAQMLTRNNKSIGLVRVTRSTAVVERPRDAFAKSVNVTQRHSK